MRAELTKQITAAHVGHTKISIHPSARHFVQNTFHWCGGGGGGGQIIGMLIRKPS